MGGLSETPPPAYTESSSRSGGGTTYVPTVINMSFVIGGWRVIAREVGRIGNVREMRIYCQRKEWTDPKSWRDIHRKTTQKHDTSLNNPLEIRLLPKGTANDRQLLLVRAVSSLEAYDASTGELVWQLDGADPRLRQDEYLTGLFNGPITMSPDSSRIYTVINGSSGPYSGTSLLIDAFNGHILASINFNSISSVEKGLQYYLSNNRKMIATFEPKPLLNQDFSLQDLEEESALRPLASFREKRCTLRGHNDHVDVNITFSPDDEHVITCSRPRAKEWCTYDPAVLDRVIVNVHSATSHFIRCVDIPVDDRAAFREMTSDFHFPAKDKWLISCAFAGVPKVRVLDAMTGVNVAVITTSLGSYERSWFRTKNERANYQSDQKALRKLSEGVSLRTRILSWPEGLCMRVQHAVTPRLSSKGMERLTITRLNNLTDLRGEQLEKDKDRDVVLHIAKGTQFFVQPTEVITAKTNASGQIIGVDVFAI